MRPTAKFWKVRLDLLLFYVKEVDICGELNVLLTQADVGMIGIARPMYARFCEVLRTYAAKLEGAAKPIDVFFDGAVSNHF